MLIIRRVLKPRQRSVQGATCVDDSSAVLEGYYDAVFACDDVLPPPGTAGISPVNERLRRRVLSMVVVI